MAAKSAKDLLKVDGLKALNKYFLYGLVVDVVVLVMLVLLIVFGIASLLTSISVLSLFSSIGFAGSLAITILLLMIYVVIIALGTVAFFSLVFSLRDLRRSSLKNAATYRSIANWLKWLVVTIVVVSLLASIFSLETSVAALSYSGSATSILIIGIAAVVSIILIALEALFAWKLATYYKKLGKSLSQPSLNTAGTLLVGAMVLIVLTGLASIYIALNASSPAYGSILRIMDIVFFGLVIVELFVVAASMYFGYRGTGAALGKSA